VTAAVVILVCFLVAAAAALLVQWTQIGQLRHDLHQLERERDGYRDDLWRRDRLGVRPKGLP